MTEQRASARRPPRLSRFFSLVAALVCLLVGGFVLSAIADGGVSHHPWGDEQFNETSAVVFVQVGGGGPALAAALTGALAGVRQWRRRGSAVVPLWLMVLTIAGFCWWAFLVIGVVGSD